MRHLTFGYSNICIVGEGEILLLFLRILSKQSDELLCVDLTINIECIQHNRIETHRNTRYDFRKLKVYQWIRFF